MTCISPRKLRAAGAVWMLAFLIWLPFEDTAVWMDVALAAGGCLWIGGKWMRSSFSIWRIAFVGALLGAATSLLAITLMAVKGGLHGHGFADFTARQVVEVVNLVPVEFLLGAILGTLTFYLAQRK